MKHIKTDEPTPEAVLRLSELDVQLAQALAKHWLVIVEQQGDEFLIKTYPQCDE